MRQGTAGQLLVDEALPLAMRGQPYVLNLPGAKALLREVALHHPDQYVVVSKKLADIGRMAASDSGGLSFGIEHLRKTAVGRRNRDLVDRAVARVLDDDTLDDISRDEAIIKVAGRAQEHQADDVYKEALAANNPLALQVLSGARGNKGNLSTLIGSDLLYNDSRERTIPVPITRSYSEGLTPEQYWAGTYGTRKGVIGTKFAVRDSGALSKQLNQVAHRLLVTEEDDNERPDIDRGLPVDTDDPDNEGALLARPAGPYLRDTVLTPKVLRHLTRLGHDNILIRSPTVGGPAVGGVYGRDAGIREFGTLPGRGSQVGLTAVQSMTEPLSQSSLSARHSGGVAGQDRGVSGFEAINQQIQVPKTFKGGAAHAQVDGYVTRIEKAPAGGHFVSINGERHYVGQGYGLKVKVGDSIEAGDMISEGLPNPAMVVKYKGIGEGRRYFTYAMRESMRDAGIKADRRNIELLSRGLIDHVALTEEDEDHVPGDVVSYSTLERQYSPRVGATVMSPRRAVGKYLERPVLHYTIGTKVRPSVLKNLEKFGIKEVNAHDEPPPFEPEMIRGMASIHHDPDWLTRMYGSGQKTSLLEAVHHGGTSDEMGTSFVPGLAKAVDFGRKGLVRTPEPGKKPEKIMPRNVKPLALSTGPRIQGPYKAATDVNAQTRAAKERVAMAKQALAGAPQPIVDRGQAGPEPQSHALGPALHTGMNNPEQAMQAIHSAFRQFHGTLQQAAPRSGGITPTPRPSMPRPQMQGTGGITPFNQGRYPSWSTLGGGRDYGHGGGAFNTPQSSQPAPAAPQAAAQPSAGASYQGGAGLTSAVAPNTKGMFLFNAGLDAAQHAGTAGQFYRDAGRGVFTGNWDNYNQTSQQIADQGQQAAADLAKKPLMTRVAAPWTNPISTAQALVGSAKTWIESQSDLEQEKARTARLDAALAARQKPASESPMVRWAAVLARRRVGQADARPL